jgi:hypothetical protein
MTERVATPDPHTAVTRELLVRYLDAWTPAVLRAHRRATYVEAARTDFAAQALGVFGEFTDRIAGHELDVVVLYPPAEPFTTALPPGLSLRVETPGELTVTGPALAHLDAEVVSEDVVWQLVTALAPGRAREFLLALPPATGDEVTGYRGRLREAGLPYAVTVELAAKDGRARLLLFATKDIKHLATFKNELWSADEFAGIRYRDPHDAERTLVDISLSPPLKPLREALLAELSSRGSCTVADLQQHTLLETIYRAADAMKVMTSAAAAGTVAREPAKGRLSPKTVVSSVEHA